MRKLRQTSCPLWKEDLEIERSLTPAPKQNPNLPRKKMTIVNDIIKNLAFWSLNYSNKNVTVKYTVFNSQCRLSASRKVKFTYKTEMIATSLSRSSLVATKMSKRESLFKKIRSHWLRRRIRNYKTYCIIRIIVSLATCSKTKVRKIRQKWEYIVAMYYGDKEINIWKQASPRKLLIYVSCKYIVARDSWLWEPRWRTRIHFGDLRGGFTEETTGQEWVEYQ